jgi:hypothetical protein
MIAYVWKDNDDFNTMKEIFNAGLPDTLYESHYELAKRGEFTVAQWHDFLNEPRVIDYVNGEIKALNQRELRRLIRDASTGKSKSVGVAQMVTALTRVLDNSSREKGGATFIYSFVPLNPKEKEAPNVQSLSDNPFQSLPKKK